MKKQGWMKRILAQGLVLCMLFALCACAAPQEDVDATSTTVSTTTTTAKAEETVTISLTVDCSNAVKQQNDVALALTEDGILYSNTSMTLPKGSTVYDALKATDLVLGAETSTYGMYVYSIQSLASGACGTMSGWMFLVNDEMAMDSCDVLTLQEGDSVRWVFSCDGGEDI